MELRVLNNGVSPPKFGPFLGEFSGEEDELLLSPPFSFFSLPILADFYSTLFVSQVLEYCMQNLTHAREVERKKKVPRKQGQKWCCEWFLFLSIFLLSLWEQLYFLLLCLHNTCFFGYNLGLP